MAATLTMDRAQAAARVAAARSYQSTDHRAMLLELNRHFRAGRVPQPPLAGPCGQGAPHPPIASTLQQERAAE
jgi:hypothetical protein